MQLDPIATKPLVTRLKRAHGHLGTVIRMLEEGEDCEDVLTQDEYARLASDGLTASPETTFPLGPAMVDLIADGALDCHWAADQSDVAVWFARLAESEEAWAARKAELLAAGWTEADQPLPGTLTAPTDYDANYVPSMVHADGVTYFVSYDRFLASIAALS